ncbi:hypothetical protein KAI31_02130 [Candidatus Bathyarchaeota archaeon]|nr:hypothetical protein [Candidatus Bathyarchaeota archaeon]
MKEENEDLLIAMLPEILILFVAVLWSIVAIMTNQGIVGLAGLAILYRRYVRSRND